MITDETLAMFELSNDLLYHRIPKERYGYYIGESLRLGREAAVRVKTSAHPAQIQKLYQLAGIEIVYQEQSGQSYGVSFRAQSEYGTDGSSRVMIYRESIQELAKHSSENLCKGENLIPPITEETALDIHLAHEYFHYLEYHSSDIKDEQTMKYYDSGFVSDYLAPVELPRILWKRRHAGILRCSEIAAHAFAKEFLGLSVLPNYYDYTYLLAEKKIRREEFWEKEVGMNV